MEKKHYPFAALVGQEELLLGLILNIINPKLGGLLIKGVKGSGKSTAVYSMTDIIPDIKVLSDCNFNCNPDTPEFWCEQCLTKKPHHDEETNNKKAEIVSIPLSITEDRLLGNVDVELLLKEGMHRFVPGALAKAHRQILYIDEVNLLPDHIVDDILDVSAMGWNHIEREGFSISHKSDFLLIGTMNPEEGELRPQILDRFPLSVEVESISDSKLRKEIINRNLAYEDDVTGFIEKFKTDTENLKNIMKLSRNLLDKIQIDPAYFEIVVKLCADKKVDGHRADIGIIKTAKTHAAFELKEKVELRHINQAAKFVLCHRTRDGGLSKPLTKSEITEYFDMLKTEDVDFHSPEAELDIDKSINLFSNGGLIQQEKK
jgi:Mg-chelatase subunit ChlI